MLKINVVIGTEQGSKTPAVRVPPVDQLLQKRWMTDLPYYIIVSKPMIPRLLMRSYRRLLQASRAIPTTYVMESTRKLSLIFSL